MFARQPGASVRPGRPRGGGERPHALLAAPAVADRAHAREHGGRHVGSASSAWARPPSSTSSTGAHPAPQGRRRGARLHAPAARRDRARAGAGGMGAERCRRASCVLEGEDHRAAPRRPAAPVPGRRCAASAGRRTSRRARAELPSRRPSSIASTVEGEGPRSRSLRASARSGWRGIVSERRTPAAPRHRATPRRRDRFLRQALAAGPRRPDGQVAGGARTRPGSAASTGSSSRRRTPSTSWSSRSEWGSGRRQGWLSNLHLGARDPRAGSS